MYKNEPTAQAGKHLPTWRIRRALKGRSRRDLMAILELVEHLVRCRDWDGLIELLSDA